LILLLISTLIQFCGIITILCKYIKISIMVLITLKLHCGIKYCSSSKLLIVFSRWWMNILNVKIYQSIMLAKSTTNLDTINHNFQVF
jgi:hypothetical protein